MIEAAEWIGPKSPVAVVAVLDRLAAEANDPKTRTVYVAGPAAILAALAKPCNCAARHGHPRHNDDALELMVRLLAADTSLSERELARRVAMQLGRRGASIEADISRCRTQYAAGREA